ncbi:hypothetical protein HDU67_001131 [Dinochytrium kinnereticum]|nr:hypothetical protein HDU67_001131 [Dinochytrium kinnereticum]
MEDTVFQHSPSGLPGERASEDLPVFWGVYYRYVPGRDALGIYIFSKDPLPQDVAFLVTETLETLRPSWTMVEDWEEAVMKFRSIVDAVNVAGAVSDVDSSEDDEREGVPGNSIGILEGESSEESDASQASGDDEGEAFVEEEEEEAILLKKEKAAEVVDEDFEREFSEMVVQSLESRKNERKAATFDVAIPGRVRVENAEVDNGEVIFSLLTKKGNRQQVKQIALPSSSSFAQNTRIKKEAELEEKQHLKRLVLNYEERERLDSEKDVSNSKNAGWRRML